MIKEMWGSIVGDDTFYKKKFKRWKRKGVSVAAGFIEDLS